MHRSQKGNLRDSSKKENHAQLQNPHGTTIGEPPNHKHLGPKYSPLDLLLAHFLPLPGGKVGISAVEAD